ncbi:MAG: hypothetical protein IAC32_01685 [Bacteroidetes bacterium]|uniref:DUF4595 domain-containing protein n=1 Tax=Candidatus Enterocola intestinipullorum TaxID=2840783 RepID=A0A9D9EF98_9BACT|nr:hypothetical protein [Candidatus Enterocola intestinipullorum]
MNQRNLFKIIALPVCLLAFGLASCEKDEAVTPPDSGGEQVLPGTAGEVTEAVTTEGGYALSYRSCIALPEGGSAEVDLTASLPASGTTTEEIVSNWDYAEEAAINSVYSGEFNREENGFIITDSLLVYTVSYGTFELTFEFPYETAQYDGTDVPEYRFEIKDKGGKFELIDSKERDGKAYALREYTHTVEAVFGGKSYEVSKSILLMRELGPANEPYLLSSIAESCKMEEVVMDGVTYIFTVNQIWSDKQSKSMEYYIVPGVWIDEKTTHLPEISNYADDLYIKNTTLNEGIRTHSNYTYDGLISYFRTTQSYLVEFNYFVLEYEFCHDDVIYDDGVLVYKDFPDIKFTDFENSFTFEKEGEVYDDGNGPCQNYRLIHTLVGRGVDADPGTATTDLIVKVRL